MARFLHPPVPTVGNSPSVFDMRTSRTAIFLAVVSIGFTRPTFTLVIDDFTSGTLAATLTGLTPSIDELQTGLNESSVIEGRRRVGVSLNYPIQPTEFAQVAIAAGALRIYTQRRSCVLSS